MKIGVHVSIEGKIYYALERAKSLGCNTLQIFIRNPRQHRKSSLPLEDIKEFQKRQKETKISPIIVHAPYISNLSSHNRRFHKITIREFIEDIREANMLGADFFVTHVGSYKSLLSEKEGIKRVVYALEEILNATEGIKTKILLENTSGSGKCLGHRFYQIGEIIHKLNSPSRIGLCMDTAHAWAGGYTLNTEAGINKLLIEIDEFIGLDKLYVIHLNDTQEKLNSRRDRHYHIGRGFIGNIGFSLLINHNLLKDKVFILETPKKSIEDDIWNLNKIKELIWSTQKI